MARKKVSTGIKLVLITSVLSSCAYAQTKSEDNKQRVYMRSDSTAPYTEVTENYKNQPRNGGVGMGSSLLWFMAFRHLGGGLGYANNSLHPNSVYGTNSAKSSAFKAQRGGFGKTSVSSKSSSFGS